MAGSPGPVAEPPASPYAAPWLAEAEIRALTPDEVRQIGAGEGAGLARAAELNGLPGPRHVLDLGAELGLTADQRQEIQAVFDAMQAEARSRGQAYLAAQGALEADFRAGQITAATLPERIREVTLRRGELETVHLAAHLATAARLTDSQIQRYQVVRGYLP